MNRRTILALAACAALSASCLGPRSPVQYEADAARFDAVGLEWIEYVDADQTLDADARARRHRTLKEWDAHLAKVAQSLGIERKAVSR